MYTNDKKHKRKASLSVNGTIRAVLIRIIEWNYLTVDKFPDNALRYSVQVFSFILKSTYFCEV